MNEGKMSAQGGSALGRKKGNMAIMAIIIVIVAITAGVIGYLFAKKTQAPVQQPVVSVPVVQPAVQPIVNEQQTQVAKAGYKIVNVKNSQAQFSFEVPEKWLTETRNAGNMSDQDFKLFASNELYLDLTPAIVNKASSAEIKKYRAELEKLPIASVSSRVIQYSDWNADQIDFYIHSKAEALKSLADMKKGKQDMYNNLANEVGENGKNNIKPEMPITISDSIIAGYPSKVLKGGVNNEGYMSSGVLYAIDIPNSDSSLIIDKQALGDSQFEADFNNIIQTFKFIDAADEIANWQTYTNAKYGFELKYPESWKKYTIKNNVQTEDNGVTYMEFSIPAKEIKMEYGDANIYMITITPINIWKENACKNSQDLCEQGRLLGKNSKYVFEENILEQSDPCNENLGGNAPKDQDKFFCSVYMDMYKNDFGLKNFRAL